ncbi:unnamed protein product [Rotaria sordida]|uniref:Cap-specific mRNA (nucleoside-2'-O-)-methyltransferase 1 n=1 Tax=Rotaria sordida TaxID=392033 RepID=A0A815H7B8_9BILA|nr:unnamed protein product [Rotaria sordida]CAF1601366.1 unnamed protein product [Rotaria sordida]
MSSNNSDQSHRGNWRGHGGDRSRYSRNDNDSFQTYNRDRHPKLTNEEYRLVNQGRDELFDKKKTFPRVNPPANISLLSSENLFATDRWDIDQLIELKTKLNDTRNQLNEKDIKVWKQHTGKTNMTGRVVWSLRNQNQIEMCTNAWIKMAEIFSKYKSLIPAELPDNQSFRSIHVCEAPGAFICATNFYHNQTIEKRNSRSPGQQWQWTGLSLNPYYEGNDQEAMVDDDRFIVETLERWYFGEDNSGNILDTNNIKGLWKRIRTDPRSNGVHLVTGDGSVDTSGDPNEQESIVSELHYAETICAMGALVKGGSLVLKMFNLFECETICLLYIVALHFEELSVFKPASSRAPNGETYIIALGFRGIDSHHLHSLLSFVSPTFPPNKALLPLNSIPESFLNTLIQIAEYFTIKQIQALERNLQLEKIWNRNVQEAIFHLNQDVVKEFRRRCSIDFHYIQQVRIVSNVELDGSAKSLGNSAAVVKGGLKQRAGGTLSDRQGRKRDREEFLLNNNNTEDNQDQEQLSKRCNLGQGKTVAVGGEYIRKDTFDEVSMQTSNDQEKESIAMKLMKKSGYIPGQGLGVHSQGRATPVETSMHESRLGLGHHYQSSMNLTSSASSTLPSVIDEPLFSSFDQSISSYCQTTLPILSYRSITIGSNLRSVLSSLFVKFDDLELLYKKREEYFRKFDRTTMNKAKIFISDQLELLMKDHKYREIHGFYLDYQSAFQLASLDKIFHLTSVNLKNSSSLSFIIDNRSLTGFAEYLVWQQQNQLNGIIISDLPHSFPQSSSVLIKSQVSANYPRVHLYFSDVSLLSNNLPINRRYMGQYNKYQFLQACRNALIQLHEGGHFVCKLLDTLTRFTAGLIYLLYRSFKSLTILRPFTVDPASSVRFLVCQELKHPVHPSISQHLDNLIKYEKHQHILEVVPLKCLLETEFQQYLADTSQRLLQREIQALNKRLFFIDQKNDQQASHQAVTVPCRAKPLPIEPDSGIILPPGWTKQWSRREERFYYFNGNTGESRWEPPI